MADQSSMEMNEYENDIPYENVGNLYMDATTSDVSFVFDDTSERIPAHKILLAISSDVFKAMFYGELKEKGDVKIAKSTPTGFKEFMQFFYLNKVMLSTENIAEVITLGHKYNVPKCLDTCLVFLNNNTLVDDDVFTIYDLAILLDLTEFKKLCENRIQTNTGAILQSSSFLGCQRDVLVHILRMDVLFCQETTLFEACMSWVKAASQQNDLTKEDIQLHLGDLFYQIRFRSMLIREFAELLQTYGHLFLAEELTEIMQMMAIKEFQPTKFNGGYRLSEWKKLSSIDCNRIKTEHNLCYYMQDIEPLKFRTNEIILLEGFTCLELKVLVDNKHCELRTKLATEVTIIENTVPLNASESKVLCYYSTKLKSKGETSVILPYPVWICPGFEYEIELKQAPEKHVYSGNVMKSAVKLEPNITISFPLPWSTHFIQSMKFRQIPNKQT